MLFQKVAVVVLGLAAFTEAISSREEARLLRRQNRNGINKAGSSSKAAAATATCLNSNAVQTGSLSDGQNPPVSGQTASAT